VNLQEAYKTLDLTPGTSKDDAKKKYRELTKKYHPDINKEPGAEDKFKKINEAYSCVQAGKGNEPQRQSSNPFGRQTYHNQENIQLNVTISFAESILGCERHFKFNRKAKCNLCNGKGEINLHNGCDKCEGKGLIVTRQGNAIYSRTCDKCYGKTDTQSCNACNADGSVDTDTSIKVTIPGGVQSGNILQLAGMGHFVGSFMHMDQRTDAHVHILVTPEPGLSLSGATVVCDLQLSLIDAIKGCKRTVKTVLGDKEVEIPAQSRNKDIVVIPNMGVNRVGDQNVVLDVRYSEQILNMIDKLMDGVE